MALSDQISMSVKKALLMMFAMHSFGYYLPQWLLGIKSFHSLVEFITWPGLIYSEHSWRQFLSFILSSVISLSLSSLFLLTKCERRVHTNSMVFNAIQNIISEILRVFGSDPRLREAFSAKNPRGYPEYESRDIQAICKFILRNNNSDLLSQYCRSSDDKARLKKAAEDLKALRNKAFHRTGHLTIPEVQNAIEQAIILVEVIRDRNRNPYQAPRSFREVKSAMIRLFLDPLLRWLGLRKGMYKRAIQNLKDLDKQWQAEMTPAMRRMLL